MMLQVIGPVRVDIAPDRIGAEPVADDVVPPAAPEERPVRRLVHEDREAELPPADDEEGNDDGQRIRCPRDESERRADEPPVGGDREPGAAPAHREQLSPFRGRQSVRPGGGRRGAFAGQHTRTLRRVPGLSQGRITRPRRKAASI